MAVKAIGQYRPFVDPLLDHLIRAAPQFAFAPESLTTLPQRAISLFTCASSCAGVEPTIW